MNVIVWSVNGSDTSRSTATTWRRSEERGWNGWSGWSGWSGSTAPTAPAPTGPARPPSAATCPEMQPSATGPERLQSVNGPARPQSATGPVRPPSATGPEMRPSVNGPARPASANGPNHAALTRTDGRAEPLSDMACTPSLALMLNSLLPHLIPLHLGSMYWTSRLRAARSYICARRKPFSFMSSFILSIHRCVPCTSKPIYLFPTSSLLVTCPSFPALSVIFLPLSSSL